MSQLFGNNGLPTVERRSRNLITSAVIALATIFLFACEPSDRTPGQWLQGSVETTFPSDWRFTDDLREIYLQVATPYFIPHSVTIWCAHADGDLYIAARDPESKNWVGWLAKDNRVRLKIDNKVYAGTAIEVADHAIQSAVQEAYSEKYGLEPPAKTDSPSVKYWSIVASN